MRCVLLCILDVLDVPEVMLCVLRCLMEVLDVPEVMRCLPLHARGAGGDALCATLLDGGVGRPEVMRSVLLCMLEMLDVMDVPEVMRCVLLCMLEAVDGTLCLLEVLVVWECWR